jgi:hypothetical protein
MPAQAAAARAIMPVATAHMAALFRHYGDRVAGRDAWARAS